MHIMTLSSEVLMIVSLFIIGLCVTSCQNCQRTEEERVLHSLNYSAYLKHIFLHKYCISFILILATISFNVSNLKVIYNFFCHKFI